MNIENEFSSVVISVLLTICIPPVLGGIALVLGILGNGELLDILIGGGTAIMFLCIMKKIVISYNYNGQSLYYKNLLGQSKTYNVLDIKKMNKVGPDGEWYGGISILFKDGNKIFINYSESNSKIFSHIQKQIVNT